MVHQFIQYLRIVGMLCGLGVNSLSAQAVYPSKQPIVQVSITQSAIKFIVLSNLDQNTTTQTNSSSTSSTSVGASFGLGAKGAGPSFTIAASKGQGNGAGAEVTHNNTRIEGNTVRIQSGGNTTLAGAVVKADTVNADIQGNLAITSLQDTSAYNETSKTSGASVTFSGAGVPTGASISSGTSKINSTYASVNEQSGIRSGNGGFNINVGGKTELVGGQITSTDKAESDKKNSFTSAGPITTSDIQNSAAYSASANSVTLGVGTDLNKSGAGTGKATGSANSTTQSGITGVAGKKDAKTGDKEVGIQPIFDKDKVKADVNAQVQITKQFGQNASKAVGDYAGEKLKAAQASGNQAEIDRWKEGGAARVALHTLVGALGGGVAGAAGAASSQSIVPMLGEQIAKLDIPLELKQVLVQVASAAVGAVAGGTAGVASAVNATGNNYLSHTELKNRAEKNQACGKGDAKACDAVKDIDKKSVDRNSLVGDGALVTTPKQAAQILNNMQTTMSGLAEYKTELQSQLDKTGDPQQRADLQNQINQADNNIKQVANLGKDYHLAQYQQTGDKKHLTAYVQLNTATSGNDLADVMMTSVAAFGSSNKGPKTTAKPDSADAVPSVNAGKPVAAETSSPNAPVASSAETAALQRISSNPNGPDLTNKPANSVVEVARNNQADIDVTRIRAPIDFDGHVTSAVVKSNGNVVGGHSVASGDVRVIPGTATKPDANGVYEARVQVADPNNPGHFLPKTNNGGISTMFPDAWTANRIKVEVDHAFQNKTVSGNIWTGVTPSGVQVRGYLSPAVTVHPVR